MFIMGYVFVICMCERTNKSSQKKKKEHTVCALYVAETAKLDSLSPQNNCKISPPVPDE